MGVEHRGGAEAPRETPSGFAGEESREGELVLRAPGVVPDVGGVGVADKDPQAAKVELEARDHGSGMAM